MIRLVKKTFLQPAPRANGIHANGRIRRPGNDNGGIDDVIRQPRLLFDGQSAGVDRVAGGESCALPQDSGYRALTIDAGVPEVLGQKRRRWNG